MTNFQQVAVKCLEEGGPFFPSCEANVRDRSRMEEERLSLGAGVCVCVCVVSVRGGEGTRVAVRLELGAADACLVDQAVGSLF